MRVFCAETLGYSFSMSIQDGSVGSNEGIMHEAAVMEMKDLLIGARVNRVQQLDRYTFLFDFYSTGENWQLLLSLRKSSQRFHLLFGQINKFYLFSSAPTDYMKKQLVGRRIAGMTIGRNSVELLFPGVRFVVDFRAVNFALKEASGSPLYSLRPYAKGGEDEKRVPKENGRVSGERVTHRKGIGDEERVPLEKTAGKNILSFTLNRSLSQDFFQERQQLLKRQLLQVIKSEEKKLKRLGEKLRIEKEEIGEKERFKKIGELMKYNLAMIPKGGVYCTLTDFDGLEMNVELDPALSQKENMDAYFKKYRKLKKREEVIEDRLAVQKRKLGLVERLIEKVQKDASTDLAHAPAGLIDSLGTVSLGKRFLNRLQGVTGEPGGRVVQKPRRFLELSSRSGKRILVARNAAENEELTLRYARGNDLWFHAESYTGSHVILQYEREGEFLEEDITDAAQLALYFSALKRQGRGNILYTRCKYVRKMKGAPPGMVSYYNEKTRWITLDEAFLKDLLSAPN